MRWSSALLFMTSLAACAPQADGSYAGEPRLTVDGIIASVDGAPASRLEPTLVWAMPDANFEAIEAKRVVVRAPTFEGRFQLVVLTEPPVSARYLVGRGRNQADDWATTRLSIGFIGARDGDRLAAVSPNHVIAFLEHDAPPGSCAERLLGAALPAGFHLLHGDNRTAEAAIAERAACIRAIPDGASPEAHERESQLCTCATRVQARLRPATGETVTLARGARALNVFELAEHDLAEERLLPEP